MIIKNALLIDPATRTSRKCDIRISDGLFREIGDNLSPAPQEETIPAEGLVASPGSSIPTFTSVIRDSLIKRTCTQAPLPQLPEDSLPLSAWQNTSPVVTMYRRSPIFSAEAAKRRSIYSRQHPCPSD